MSVSDAKRLKELEIENTRLKKLLAESLQEDEVTSKRRTPIRIEIPGRDRP
jgi:putative transposase